MTVPFKALITVSALALCAPAFAQDADVTIVNEGDADQAVDNAEQALEDAGAAVEGAAQGAGEAAEDAADATVDAADDAADATADAAEDAANVTIETADEVGETAEDAANVTIERAEDAGEAAEDAADPFVEGAEEAADNAEAAADEAMTDADEAMDEVDADVTVVDDGTPVEGQLFEADATDIRASEMLAARVLNDAGERVGDINDLLMTPDGELKGVVIGVGGFLGIGEKRVAVEYDRLSIDHSGDELAVMINATAEELENAPAFEPATE